MGLDLFIIPSQDFSCLSLPHFIKVLKDCFLYCDGFLGGKQTQTDSHIFNQRVATFWVNGNVELCST